MKKIKCVVYLLLLLLCQYVFSMQVEVGLTENQRLETDQSEESDHQDAEDSLGYFADYRRSNISQENCCLTKMWGVFQNFIVTQVGLKSRKPTIADSSDRDDFSTPYHRLDDDSESDIKENRLSCWHAFLEKIGLFYDETKVTLPGLWKREYHLVDFNWKETGAIHSKVRCSKLSGSYESSTSIKFENEFPFKKTESDKSMRVARVSKNREREKVLQLCFRDFDSSDRGGRLGNVFYNEFFGERKVISHLESSYRDRMRLEIGGNAFELSFQSPVEKEEKVMAMLQRMVNLEGVDPFYDIACERSGLSVCYMWTVHSLSESLLVKYPDGCHDFACRKSIIRTCFKLIYDLNKDYVKHRKWYILNSIKSENILLLDDGRHVLSELALIEKVSLNEEKGFDSLSGPSGIECNYFTIPSVITRDILDIFYLHLYLLGVDLNEILVDLKNKCSVECFDGVDFYRVLNISDEVKRELEIVLMGVEEVKKEIFFILKYKVYNCGLGLGDVLNNIDGVIDGEVALLCAMVSQGVADMTGDQLLEFIQKSLKENVFLNP